MSRIILASASPRRRELMNQIGLKFEVFPSSKEEVLADAGPAQTVMALAAAKAQDVFSQTEDREVLVIGADTVVSKDGVILGKPKNVSDAQRMLGFLQGESHQVYTGVCLITAAGIHSFYEKTDVTMYALSDADIEAYIATNEPMDKAGSYGIQGLGAVFVREIHGDYNNVVGLPVASIWHRLMKDAVCRKIVEENKQ